MRATSASQRTESSYAFLSSPFLLLANVTCLLILFSIRLSSTLPLPISLSLSLSLSHSFLSRLKDEQTFLKSLCLGTKWDKKEQKIIIIIKNLRKVFMLMYLLQVFIFVLFMYVVENLHLGFVLFSLSLPVLFTASSIYTLSLTT
jgi:hypothetical protein